MPRAKQITQSRRKRCKWPTPPDKGLIARIASAFGRSSSTPTVTPEQPNVLVLYQRPPRPGRPMRPNPVQEGVNQSLCPESLPCCEQQQQLKQKQQQQRSLPPDAKAVPGQDMACCVCLDNKVVLMVTPCNHACLCGGCFKALPTPRTCPTCREVVTGRQPVYL